MNLSNSADSQARNFNQQPTPIHIAKRLRILRKSLNISLAQVEERSGGAIKAVVLGSYERGSRAISVARLIEIADFYDLPVVELLDQERTRGAQNQERVIVDLRRLKIVTSEPANLVDIGQPAEVATALRKIASTLANLRQDWNGEIFSLRAGDLTTLAMMTGFSQDLLVATLHSQKLLLTAKC